MDLPEIQVDLAKLAHHVMESARSINPMQRIPVLVLDVPVRIGR
jgi:glutathione S-transferase